MPFAGYTDFADCMAQNSRKEDPGAYCATIQRAVEKAAMDDLEKAGKTKTVAGEALHAKDFAYVGDPDDPATWKLPIHDASHARNALARFNQTEGIPSGEKSKVLNRIKSRARSLGVHVSEKFEIAKVDEERRLVFGWASVAVKKDGQVITDLQGDRIAPDVLEATAYRYVLEDGDGNVMHTADRAARLVESFVVTPEKLEKMGLASNALPEGWWVGYYVEDETAWQGVKSGTLRAFSIEGSGERVPA